jgi:Cdc6-like AAA superfamily ATPase
MQTIRILAIFSFISAHALIPDVVLAKEALTETDVLRFAQQIEDAAESLDARKLLSHLSKSVVIERQNSKGKITKTQDYRTYKAWVQKAFPIISYYKYTRTYDSVEIASDAKTATYTVTLEENYVYRTKYFRSKHREVWDIVLEDGEMKLAKVVARAK